MSAASNVITMPVKTDDAFVEVAPGTYQATYTTHTGCQMFGAMKLRVDFTITDYGKAFGVVLPRWYRVIDHRHGRIRAGQHSALVRELSAVLGRRLRHDRLPVSDLKGLMVIVAVDRVKTDGRQHELAPVNQYTVIREVVRQA